MAGIFFLCAENVLEARLFQLLLSDEPLHFPNELCTLHVRLLL